MRTTPIPVIAGAFEARRKHEGLKVTTVTRMATSKRTIPVTVDTSEALRGWGGYRDTGGGGGWGWRTESQHHRVSL